MTQHPTQSPQFFLTAPSPCPYLEGQFERKVFTHLVGDGICDDGGSGSTYAACQIGQDCTDCGPRARGDAAPSPSLEGAVHAGCAPAFGENLDSMMPRNDLRFLSSLGVGMARKAIKNGSKS